MKLSRVVCVCALISLAASLSSCRKTASTRQALDEPLKDTLISLAMTALRDHGVSEVKIAKAKAHLEEFVDDSADPALDADEMIKKILGSASTQFVKAARYLGMSDDAYIGAMKDFSVKSGAVLKNASSSSGADMQMFGAATIAFRSSLPISKLNPAPTFNWAPADIKEMDSTKLGSLIFQTVSGITNYKEGGSVSPNTLPPALTQVKTKILQQASDEGHEDLTKVKEATVKAAESINTKVSAPNQIDTVALADEFDAVEEENIATLAPTLTYSADGLNEAAANNGSIDGFVTVTATKDTFVVSTGTLTANTHYTLSGTAVPSGLTAVVTVMSSTVARISFTGNAASHDVADSVADITVTFLDAAFTKQHAPVDGSQEKDLDLTFFGTPVLTLSGTSFSEAIANDGSIATTRTVTVAGDTWGMANGTLTENTHYYLSGTAVPAGLSLVVTKTASDTLEITFTGTAAAHLSANNASGIEINFYAAAFTRGLAPSDGSGTHTLSISYLDAKTLAYSATEFTEAVANDGSISNTLTVTLSDGNFSQTSVTLTQNTHYTLSNTAVPTGLSLVVTITSATTAQISLTGNAAAHETADDVSNITIEFLDAAFVGSAPIDGTEAQDLSISYVQAPTLTYSDTKFVESMVLNDGTVDSVVVVTLESDTFSNGPGFLVEDTHYTVSGTALPSGLGILVHQITPNTAIIYVTDFAISHAAADSVSGVVITFLDAAFTSGSRPADGTYTKSFDINFVDNAAFMLYATDPVNGSIGGRSGADSLCFAYKPNNATYGSSRAFLTFDMSDNIANMPTNFSFSTNVEIRSRNGTLIANDWADLMDGSIQNSLQSANVTSASQWWSGSDYVGTFSGANCLGYTSASSGEESRTGLTNSTGTSWMEVVGSPTCDDITPVVLCLAYD